MQNPNRAEVHVLNRSRHPFAEARLRGVAVDLQLDPRTMDLLQPAGFWWLARVLQGIAWGPMSDTYLSRSKSCCGGNPTTATRVTGGDSFGLPLFQLNVATLALELAEYAARKFYLDI